MKGNEWLTSLDEKRIVPGLRNVSELLRRLGEPQRDFRSIHVAGSDGKGSVCEMVYSVLRDSGIRTGKFSSPYIESRNESISVDGQNIQDQELEALLSEIRDVNADMAGDGFECTFFEVLAAAAFLWFSRSGVEYAVIETGMGGKLDATNVVVPEVSVITNISREHTGFLGSTIREIASHKAGIIKDGVPVVTAAKGEALEVIRSKAAECRSELTEIRPAEPLSMDETGSEVMYRGGRYRIGIPGSYQCENMALAVEALSCLPVSGRILPYVAEGLADASLSGRMERVPGMPMVIDGTHTVAGMDVLCKDMERIYGKVAVVVGMLSDKDAAGIMERLAHVAETVIVTSPESERAMSADDLADIASGYFVDTVVMGKESDALDYAVKHSGRTILVTGSFRMVEGAKRWLRTRSVRSLT